MTPYEFRLHIEAHNEAREQHLRDMAWQSCNIVNVWLKKKDRVKPEDLVRSKSRAIKLGSGVRSRMLAAEHNKKVRNYQAVRALMEALDG